MSYYNWKMIQEVVSCGRTSLSYMEGLRLPKADIIEEEQSRYDELPPNPSMPQELLEQLYGFIIYWVGAYNSFLSVVSKIKIGL